ncbi:MAG: DUF3572 domain-containing protein [Rhodobacteraceae bacterium]|nr:DUF3572 domain-containing protein [Paracoccaceae bacterium]
MTGDQAQIVALRALEWIATDADTLGAFLAAAGIGPERLRAGAADPDFLAAVLDFLTEGDARIRAFCEATGLPPTAPMAARAALPGGGQVHWT